VIKIWAEWKYRKVDPELLSLWEPKTYDLHLLCYPDLPYEDDPLRENPDPEDRLALFNKYQSELVKSKVPFELIKGNGDSRLKKAKEVLDSRFTS
jgi:nicotinamide riboside kinase